MQGLLQAIFKGFETLNVRNLHEILSAKSVKKKTSFTMKLHQILEI